MVEKLTEGEILGLIEMYRIRYEEIKSETEELFRKNHELRSRSKGVKGEFDKHGEGQSSNTEK